MRGGIPEVLVLGGGPAGCAAATLLTRWGHDVLLVTKPGGPEDDGRAESLTPSCAKFFDLLGVSADIDRAGFVRTTGNTVWWGSGPPRVEMFAGGARGWQTTSARLEAVLLQAARDAGVRVERRLLTPQEAADAPAGFRMDCTGRAGLLARARAGRQYEEGHRTVALIAVWDRPSWPLPDPTHTIIESYADGWAWSVPLDDSRRAVAVMVDPRTSALSRGEGARTTYLAELAKTKRMAGLVAGAGAAGGPAGWDASMYRASTYAGTDWLAAGDAASFVDPLSSAGVRKALASGWLAAIALHTALARPAMAETALAFYAARESEVYAGFLSLTRRFLAEAAHGRAQPFWTERADLPEDPAAPDEMAARDRAAIVAAHDRLRRAPALALRIGPGVRTALRPAISGAEIVMEPRLIAGADSAGVRYVQDVDVVTLVELAPMCSQVPDLYEACVRRSGPTDLAAFLAALATAVARGWLVDA